MKLKIKNLKKINFVQLLKLGKFKRQFIFVAALVIFVVLNLLLSPLSLRLDFSKGQAYTLSPSTKNILRHLDKTIEIKFFVSSDLPTKLIPVKNEVVDFLNEYSRQGRGKISVKTIDPKKDEAAKSEVQETGIPELQFSQLETDKYALTTAYFGILILSGENKEIIAQATDVDSLEYNLTSAIYKLVKQNLGKIAVVGMTESFDTTTDNLVTLKKVLRQQFEVDFIDISAESEVEEISKDYKAIIVFDDNQKEYSSEEVAKIQKYLDKKGTAVFFVDGVWVLPSLEATESKNGLFALLRDWGIEVNKNLVLSSTAEMVNFGTETLQFYSIYPFWIKTNNFNADSSFFSNINYITFPWVSSLTPKSKTNIEVKFLVKTTKNSWQQKNNFTLNPQSISSPTEKELQEFTVVAQAKKKDSGQIVVIPSSRFVQENYLSRTSDNLGFTLNVLNDLASGGALSGIHQRSVSYYPLPELAENQKDIFKYLNILLLPGLLAVYGVFRLTRKRS